MVTSCFKTLSALILGVLFTFVFAYPIRAATYTVTKTVDTNDGTCNSDCSLREAVIAANSNSGADTIVFSIPNSDSGYNGTDDTWTITLTSGLTISSNQSVTFDGTTQTGLTSMPTYGGKVVVRWTTNLTALTSNSGSDVVINHLTFKSASPASTPGFSLLGTTGSLDIQNSLFTRDAQSANNNTSVALTSTGNVIFSNNKIEYWNRAMQLTNANPNATITLDSNVLLTPGSIGLRPTGYNIHVTNNTINGSSDQGILVSCTGGICTVANNTITSPLSGFASIVITGAGSFSVTNNNIDSANSSAIYAASTATISANTVSGGSGSTTSGKINVVTNDLSKPVTIVNNTIELSNSIPIWIAGANTRSRITQNSIRSSFPYSPINLSGGTEDSALVSANDLGDSDIGANNLMNYPVIQSVCKLNETSLVITADLDFLYSEAPYTLEFFDNTEISSSGHGGGQTFLGSVSTSEIGNGVQLTVNLVGTAPSSPSNITATATNTLGSTSEFSAPPSTSTYDTGCIPTPTPSPSPSSSPSPVPSSDPSPSPSVSPPPQVNSVGSSRSSSAPNEAKPPTCTDAVPVGETDFFQINRTKNTSTLYFTPVNDNVEKYHVVYGFKEKDERFGSLSNPVTKTSNTGVQSLTISDLNSNSEYWFKVAPVNGCAVGTWSSWMKADKWKNRNSFFYKYLGV